MPKESKPSASASIISTVYDLRERGMAITVINVAQNHPGSTPRTVIAKKLKSLAGQGKLVKKGKIFSLPAK